MANTRLILFIVYLVFGLYFINETLKFVAIPKFFSDINSWIILVGGILIILGGINHLRVTNYRYRTRAHYR